VIFVLQAAGEPTRVIVESGPGLSGWEIAGIAAGIVAALLAALAAWRAEKAARSAAEALWLARQERREDDVRRVGQATGALARHAAHAPVPNTFQDMGDLRTALVFFTKEDFGRAWDLLARYERREVIDEIQDELRDAALEEVRDRLTAIRAERPSPPWWRRLRRPAA
jgi:hypothetical protein